MAIMDDIEADSRCTWNDSGGYWECTIGSDSAPTFDITETDDTMENVLFDITSNNSSVLVRPMGEDITVRNVGVRGQADNTSNQDGRFATVVSEGGGEVLFENVYLGDGDVYDSSQGGGGNLPKGIFFHRDTHVNSTLRVRNTYVADYADNGMYLSAPAMDDGSKQSFIENCYGEGCGVNNFRIGGDGAYVEDSVSVNGPHRGIWCKDGDGHSMEIRGCDIHMDSAGTGLIGLGSGSHGHAVDVSVSNTQAAAGGTNNIPTSGSYTCPGLQSNYHVQCSDDGSSASFTNCGTNPSTDVPTGVPTTPESAAGGGDDNTDGFTFTTVLDAVDDLGMDPQGGTAIDSALTNAYASNTVIEFPEGDYRVSDTLTLSGESHFGMRGLGGEHDGVLFVPDSDVSDGRWLESTSGSHHLFENFSVQMDTDGSHYGDAYIRHADGTLVRDVEWVGFTPEQSQASAAKLQLECSAEAGVVAARRVYMREECAQPGGSDGVRGIHTGSDSLGEVQLEDVHVENNGAEGYYAAQAQGPVTVVDSLFRNNSVGNVTVSASDDLNNHTVVLSTTVEVDSTDLRNGQSDPPTDTVGVAADDDGAGKAENLRIQNSVVDVLNSASGATARGITAPSGSDHGAFSVQNTRIRNQTSAETVLLESGTEPDDVTFTDCDVTGGGGPLESNRDATLQDCCVDSAFTITGFSTSNLTGSGCLAPGDDPDDGEPVTFTTTFGNDTVGDVPAGWSPEWASDSTNWSVIEESDSNGGGTGGDVIGGGDGYTDTFASGDGDYTVSTQSELSSALSSASSGEVIFVDSNIDVGGSEYTIDDGVTLASDRGVDGSPGALIETTDTTLFSFSNNVRLSGLRMAGPYDQTGGSTPYGSGITIGGTGNEIDNCEIATFSYAGVRLNSGATCHIHHCYHHDTNKGGSGYGVDMGANTDATVERNYFHNHRHCIAASGSNEGYTFRLNHLSGDQTGVTIDIHDDAQGDAATYSEINNNVVELSDNECVQIRGTPIDAAHVWENWFYNPNAPPADQPSNWSGHAIIQTNVTGFQNVFFTEPPTEDGVAADTNSYGSGALSSFDQVISNHPGAWHRPWDPSSEPASVEAANGDGDVIGGGDGYTDTFASGDYTASTQSELSSALSNAGSGDVVYISDGFVSGSSTFDVPNGVTVAGDRGVDGSAGPLVQTDNEPNGVFELGGGARLTGIRLRGPYHDVRGLSNSQLANETSSGVHIPSGDNEVDNCVIYGFGLGGIWIEAGGGSNHFHHNYIYQNNTSGLGYGIAVYGANSNPVIEYNYFNDNRHSVASNGENYGYVCRYNHLGPRTYHHVLDIHDPGATETHIHDNISESVFRDLDDNRAPQVAGTDSAPDDSIIVEDNWWYQEQAYAYSLPSTNVTIQNNYYTDGASVNFGDIISGHPGAWHRPWDSSSDPDDDGGGTSSDLTDGQALQFSATSDDRHAIEWSTVGEVENAEVLTLSRVSAFSSGSGQSRIYLRASGTDGSQDTYIVDVTDSSIILNKYTGGSLSEITSISETFPTNTWVYTRARVEDDVIRVRFWEADDDEPSQWDIDEIDTDHQAGWVGVGSYGSNRTDWDVVTANVAGASAPVPGEAIDGAYQTTTSGLYVSTGGAISLTELPGASFTDEATIEPMTDGTSFVSTAPFTATATGDIAVVSGPATSDGDMVSWDAVADGGAVEIAYSGDLSLDWDNIVPHVEVNGSRVDPYDLSGDGPRETWLDGSGSEVLETTLYTTQAVADSLGWAPAKSVAAYVSNTLQAQDLSHDILAVAGPVDVGSHDTDCPNGDTVAYDYWNDEFGGDSGHNTGGVTGDTYVRRKDSNVLLTEWPGGGCGSIGGAVSVSGVQGLSQIQEPDATEPVRTDDDGNRIYVAMHEMGHNLGFEHDNAGGEGWYVNANWHETPCSPTPGMTNICGTDVPPRDQNETGFYHHLHYTDCSVSQFRSNIGGGQEGNTQSYAMSDSETHDCPHCGCD